MSIRRIFELVEAFKGKPYPLTKPIFIQFPVNDICDAKCQMCNVWQQHLDNQLSLAEIEHVFSNPLFSRAIGVGLNGGEPTLRADLPDIAEILYKKLPRLRHISLITNGTKADRVIERIDQLAAVIKKNRGYLDVMVSLDGVGDVHDRVRGREGNFRSALEVLDHVRKHSEVQNVRIGCTVIRDNVYGIHDLYDFARQRGVYIKYRLGVPHQRLYTSHVDPKQIGKRTWIFNRPYDLDFSARIHLSEFLWGLIRHYEPSWQQRFFYQSLIGQLLEGKPRQAGCDWQHRGATVSARGELLYCAVKSPVLGDARFVDAQQMYFDNVDKLREIIDKHCDTCAHDYVGRPPRKVLLDISIRQFLAKINLKPAAIKNLPVVRQMIASNAQKRFHNKCYNIQNLVSVTIKPLCKIEPSIMICGWYGTETLGDKAILGGVVSVIRQLMPNARFILASLFPYISRLTCLQMPELASVEVVNIQEAATRMSESNLLVFGGGPIMAIEEIAYIAALFTAAKKLGIPSVVAGCGVGPLGANYVNMKIRDLLNLADIRIYRDKRSYDVAKKLGVNVSDDAVAEDPAFEWIALKRNELTAAIRKERPTLLLGLRDWPYREYAAFLSENDAITIKKHYENEVLNALGMVIKSVPDLVVLPLPMCTNHFGDDDRFYYRELFKGWCQKISIDYKLLGQELTPKDYLKEFMEAHCALTMRFHASVFAIGCGLPGVALDYTLGQGKVASVAERYGMPCFDLRDVEAKSLANVLLEQLHKERFNTPLTTFPNVLVQELKRVFDLQTNAQSVSY